MTTDKQIHDYFVNLSTLEQIKAFTELTHFALDNGHLYKSDNSWTGNIDLIVVNTGKELEGNASTDQDDDRWISKDSWGKR